MFTLVPLPPPFHHPLLPHPPAANSGSTGENGIRNKLLGASLPQPLGGALLFSPAAQAGALPCHTEAHLRACLGHRRPPASQLCLCLPAWGSREAPGLAVPPVEAGSCGWQRSGGRKGPPGRGALDELQSQHICANITNYFSRYKHPAGSRGGNQPKLFKIETEIAAQGCRAPGRAGALHQDSPPAALPDSSSLRLQHLLPPRPAWLRWLSDVPCTKRSRFDWFDSHQGTRPGFGFGPGSGCVWEATDGRFSLPSMFLPLPSSLPGVNAKTYLLKMAPPLLSPTLPPHLNLLLHWQRGKRGKSESHFLG